MSKELLHTLLNKSFYLDNKDLLDRDLFEDVTRDLFDTLEWAYKEGTNSLSIHELGQLHLKHFPAETETRKALAKSLLSSLDGIPAPDIKVAKLILTTARINSLEDSAAQLLLERNTDIDKIKEILYQIERLKTNEKSSDIVDLDIISLLERTSKNSRWKFNIPALSDMCGGLGDGVFCVIAGRVNSGKSLSALSFCFSPGGFAEQGAKILYLGNEEDGGMPGIRSVMAYTGMTIEEIRANKEEAAKIYSQIRNNIIILDNAKITMTGLHKMVDKYKPDIVVADMLDHIQVTGEYAREDLRLGQVYRQSREIAKMNKLAFIGVSQTSAESDGKMHYGFDALAGSKTDKAAACDLILLLGQEAPDENGNYSLQRAVNVAKNKITGHHGAVTTMIQPMMSRLVA